MSAEGAAAFTFPRGFAVPVQSVSVLSAPFKLRRGFENFLCKNCVLMV